MAFYSVLQEKKKNKKKDKKYTKIKIKKHTNKIHRIVVVLVSKLIFPNKGSSFQFISSANASILMQL